MPFLFLTIAVACWIGIIQLMARRGQLTLTDARFGWGSVVFYGCFSVWIGVFLLLFQVARLGIVRFLPTSMHEAANIAAILAIAGGLGHLERRVLSRCVTYRKLRYIKHWNFGDKR